MNKQNRNFVLWLIFLFITFMYAETKAQQQVMFTQYMFNGLAINPAYAGAHNTFSATLLIRDQWVGLDGAPKTQTLGVHTPIADGSRSAVGLNLIHDKIGVIDQVAAYGAYSYRVPINDKTFINLGLQAGLNRYAADFASVDANDENFGNANITESKFNVGFGALVIGKRFHFGISMPQTLETQFGENIGDSDSRFVRHFFSTFGYLIPLNQNLKIKPNLLIKAVNGAPIELDLNANLIIKDFMWVGLSWRSFDSFDALFEMQLTETLAFGYSYDFATTTELRRVNSGSHEFMLNFRLKNKQDKIITPRFF